MKKILCFLLYALCSLTLHAATTQIQDTEIEAVLYELVEPLADAAGIPHGRMRIHILANDDFNAFVTRGEDVYIYTGLITRIESPGAFQAVIAHELGHMIGGHMAHMSARISAEMKRSLIVQALGVALMVANPMAGVGVMAGAGGMATQSMMAFTRDEERIADNMGIDLMIKAGLDPNGFVEVMKQMNDMVGALESRVNPNNLNHPMTAERLKNIREKISASKDQIEKSKKNASPQRPLTEEYKLIRAKITGYLSPASHVKNTYPNSDKSGAAIYARAIGTMRAGNLTAAKTGTLTLISRAPDNPYFYELLGDIEYQFGHYDDSVSAYEKSLELMGAQTAPQIQTALGIVLAERKKLGDADRAVEMAKRAILTEPSSTTYWVLARAEGIRGNPGIADWAMAEHYMMLRQVTQAQEFARRAQSQLPRDSPEYIKAGDILKSSKK